MGRCGDHDLRDYVTEHLGDAGAVLVVDETGDLKKGTAGIEVVLTGIRAPLINAIMQRWVPTCRRGLLDRTLAWNQRHLLHALR